MYETGISQPNTPALYSAGRSAEVKPYSGFNETTKPLFRSSKTYASDTRAYLNRQIYSDYLNRFQPHEQELINSITGEDLLNERLASIRVNEQNAFGASKATAGRRRERYGATQTQNQAQSQNLNRSLSQASTTASVENATRQHVHDRNMALISGVPRQAIQGV